jgi:TPR repeat protein
MYEQGQGVPQDYAEAVRWYRKAADQGHAGAQLFLGLMYDRGQGVPQDYAEAVHWFCKAADQGRALAQVKLAESYSHGQGVPQDYAEAARWYRKAADQGLAVAQCNLGVRYDKGQGVPQDYAEAVQWYRKAAEQGLAAAQLSLGSMYYRGQGVPQDYAEAARWLCKAAEQGEALAQFILGGMYQQGEGMTQDGVQALIWFNLAASRASGDLKQLCVGALDVVAKGLTAEQRVEAQRLVREWKPKGGGKAHDQETSVSSPQQGTFYCDICNEPLDVQKAYLLTTSQVVLSAAHWEFFWRHYPDHAARAGERGEKLSSYAIEKAADLTHWSVCQRCVGLCTEQPAASARSFREQVRFDGGTLIAPLCGPPPDWKLAVAAAEEAWAKAFGSRPLKNLGGSILSASLAVYDKSCRRWNIERFSAHRKAAEQGDAVAQSVLGSCYASGAGVEQDHAEAAKWWRKAAEQGDVGAQYSLGVCYAKGNGVAKDQPEAVRWFRKAAEQGHADAQGVLGDRFDEGEGVGQDHAEAVKWYRKAAEQGIAAAQNNLGACYVKGEGVV